MKRRRFVKGVFAVPAAATLAVAQQPSPAPSAPPPATPNSARPVEPSPAADSSQLEYTIPEHAAQAPQRFFNPQQFAALRKLGDIIMPRINTVPGAIDARAPEFLDFLIGESPAERQQLYRAGLDALNAQAKKRFDKAFAEVDATQAAALLAPLKEPWTYEPPADPLARFLRAAKSDIRTATMNSQEYANAAGSGGGRRGGGMGQYWYPID